MKAVVNMYVIKMLPPYHPIYSERLTMPTIMFVPQTQEPLKPEGSDGDAADPATDKDEG